MQLRKFLSASLLARSCVFHVDLSILCRIPPIYVFRLSLVRRYCSFFFFAFRGILSRSSNEEYLPWLLASYLNFWFLFLQSVVKRNDVMVSMIQYGAVTANAYHALFTVKPHFIVVFLANICSPGVISGITWLEFSNFFNLMTTKSFHFSVSPSAVFTQEMITIGTIELQRLSFVAVSAFWWIFMLLCTVSLDNVHHLLVKQVGRKAADVVRAVGDLTAGWTT